QTKRLRTQLHFIRPMGFRAAALVFHRKSAFACLALMKLDRIRLASDSQFKRQQWHGGNCTHPPPILGFEGISTLVQQAPLRGLPVFSPLLFQMDQRTLSRTVQVVLEGRKWEQIIVVYSVHSFSSG